MKRFFKGAFLLTLTFGCSPKAPEETAPVPETVLPVFSSRGMDNGESVFPDGSEVLPFLETPSVPGNVSSLSQLGDDFWDNRGLPKGGARLYQGLVLWIESPKGGSAEAVLKAWNGTSEYTLLSSEEWAWPFFLLSRKLDSELLYVYCCIGSSVGCYAGPGFYLDLTIGSAVARREGYSEADFRAVDFPDGNAVQYEDEQWFAFRDGSFLARVLTEAGLAIVEDNGLDRKVLFPAKAAGATLEVIGDAMTLNADGNIVYWNSVAQTDSTTGQVSEQLWEGMLQDGKSGSILFQKILPYDRWLNASETLGLTRPALVSLRPPRFDTEWKPAMGYLDDNQPVLVLRFDDRTVRVQSPTEGVVEVPWERVSFRP